MACEHNNLTLDRGDNNTVTAGCVNCGIWGKTHLANSSKHYDLCMAASSAVHNLLYTAPELLERKKNAKL